MARRPAWLKPRWPAAVAMAFLVTCPVLMLGWMIHSINRLPRTLIPPSEGADVQRGPADDGIWKEIPILSPDTIEVRRMSPEGLPEGPATTFAQSVYIRVPMSAGLDTTYYYGSGFVIEPNIVVTAAHVIQDGAIGNPKVGCITSRGEEEVEAVALAIDRDRDVAVLGAEGCTGAVREIPERLPAIGDALLTVGFAFGSDDGVAVAAQAVMPTAIVPMARIDIEHFRSDDSVRRIVTAWRTRHIPEAYAISGALIPGKSGSPVFDSDGIIVGVVIITDPLHNRSYVVPNVSLLHVLRGAGLRTPR